MPPRPQRPLGAAASGGGFAIHLPAQRARLGLGAFQAQALAVGGDVRVQRDDGAGGGRGDAHCGVILGL